MGLFAGRNRTSAQYIAFLAMLLLCQLAQAGTVWLSGSAWLGGNGCDVYSFNSSDVGQRSYYNGVDVGLKWQCVELPGRLYTMKGWRSGHFPNANQIYGSAASMGLIPHANGSGYIPVPGDMVTWNAGSFGHVAVVDYVDATKVHIVEENFSSTVRKTMTRSGTGGSHVERDDGWGVGHCQGFIHSAKNTGTTGVDGAALTSANYPDGSVLTPGQAFTKTFTIKNTGTTTWIANGANGYTLNHNGDVPASPNLGAAYQAIPASSIAAGASYVFSVPLHAPTTPGNYEADFQMNSSASVYFGPKVWAKITVSAAATTNNASLVSLAAPASVTAGQVFSATIVMGNTGSKPWVAGGSTPHNLGSQSPQDNSTWGFSRVALASSPVNPGQNATFTFNATAPPTPGTYTFAWKMVQDSVAWFGATASQTITVVSNNSARYWDINGATAGAGGTSPGGAWTGSFWSTSPGGTGTPAAWTANSDAVFSAGSDATGFFKVTAMPNTSWKSATVEQGQVQLEGSYVTNSGTSGTAGTTLLTVATGAYLSMTSAPGIYLAGNGITKRGAGGMNVGGNEFYTGPTYIEAGTVTVVSDLPAKQPFGLGAPGSANATIHLLGDGMISAGLPLPANGTAIYLTNQYVLSLEGGAIEVGSAGTQFTIAARLTGSGSLVKLGTGTLTLSQSNTYTAGTVVSQGTLIANTNGCLGTGDVDIQSSARLALEGAYFKAAHRLHLNGTAMVTNSAANTAYALSFDGGLTYKRAGTWGSSTSGATYQDNTRFAGTGKLTVANGPASAIALGPPNPSTYGEPVTLIASVVQGENSLTGANTPTGTVTFYDGASPIGSPAAVTAGISSVVTTNLTVGDHAITAAYSGDNTFAGSSASVVTQTVVAASVSLNLTSSLNPSAPGSNVIFTASLAALAPAPGIPTGNVIFRVNDLPFSTNALVGGVAVFATASLPAGIHDILAEYQGDGTFESNVDDMQQIVQAPTPCSQTNNLLSFVSHPDGSLTLNFQGTPGAEYYVIANPELTAADSTWSPVPGSTNSLSDPAGFWSFTVTNSAPQMYYRAAASFGCP